jgi:cytochrome c biogenesis protein CcmG, thiol:disulfide interchange protein DsbE
VQRYLPWAGAIVVLGVAAAVAAPYFFSQPPNVSGPSSAAGRPAPVFTLRDDLGRSVSLRQYRGSIVVMNLWASWCPPCRAEMPDLQKLADTYGPRGIAVVGINEGESPQRARAFAGSLRIRFPIWIDSSEQYGRTYTALGLPTTVIVDRRGIVARGFDGALTLDQMRAAVASAMHST